MLKQLRSHMFTRKKLSSLSLPIIMDKVSPRAEPTNILSQKNDELFIPKYKDTLFWCFYIMRNSFVDYALIGNQSFKVEKEMKIACIEYLRTKKDLLKKNKWRRTIIETDLLNNSVISMQTFVCLCALYDIDITIVNDYYYYTYGENIQNIVKKNGDDYGLYKVSSDVIEKELKNYWSVDSLTKPLKGISSYKVGELKRICKHLNINIYKKGGRGVFNKKEIYNLIKAKIE